jgi:hypothetical protein
MGRTTIVDLDIADEIEAELPAAIIKPEPHRPPSPPVAPVVRRIAAQPAAPIARSRLNRALSPSE